MVEGEEKGKEKLLLVIWNKFKKRKDWVLIASKVQDINQGKLVQPTKKGKLVMKKKPYKNVVILTIKLAKLRMQKRNNLLQFCRK